MSAGPRQFALACGPPERVIARNGDREVTVAQALTDALRLAERLPAQGTAINLCRNRYRFTIGLWAAAVNHHLTLLPSDSGRTVLDKTPAGHPQPYSITDNHLELSPSLASFEVDADGNNPGEFTDLPRFDADDTAVHAFTSGTTGAPQAHAKTWAALREGVRCYQLGLELPTGDGSGIVATVPPGHMYGLECSVLVPMFLDTSIVAAQPLLPADVAAALARIPGPRVLFTTPLHLRALLRSGCRLPTLHTVVSASAPLSDALAREIENRFDTRVLEVYGCTEAGIVATRRTVNGPLWRCAGTMRIESHDTANWAHADQLARPVALPDRLVCRSALEFELAGRDTDLVKVAGKRASLAALDAALGEIEGVVDGAFYFEREHEDTAVRPVVFAVSTKRSAEEILAALRKQLDPAFLPRLVHLVSELPRSDTGKLPRGAFESFAARYSERRTNR